MKNKTVGTILLSVAGFVAALGTAGAQIANGIVLAAFYQAKGGNTPPNPSAASPHWLVFVLTVALAASGLFFLFSRSKTD